MMAGGGMGGVSSTGFGAPSGTSPFGSNPVDDSIMSDDFGRNHGGGASGPGAPMLSNIMPGLMSGAMGLGGFGQQQQLAPGATAPASQEVYMNTLGHPAKPMPNFDAMSGLLRGYANQGNMAQPQVPDWMKAQLAAPEQQAATPVATATPAATTPVATTPAAPTPVNTGDQVADLYQNLLGRKADEGGYNFWNQALQGGASIDAIRNQMMTSPEYQTNQIKGMYQNLFGREADQGGLDFWANAAKQGTSLDDIKNQLMQSTEYQTRQSQLAQAPAQAATQAATQAVTPPPMFKKPTMSQSGGEGSGGALNFQYRRGGIASLLRRR